MAKEKHSRSYLQRKGPIVIKAAAQAMFVAGAFFLAGCIRLGPDFREPSPVDVPARFEQAGGAVSEEGEYFQDPSAWWTRFGDRRLDSVVEAIVANNHDLKKAAAALLELRAAYRQSLGESLPVLSADASATRKKQNFLYDPLGGGIGAASRTTAYNLYDAGLGLSFELDLFGRLARTREAAWSRVLKGEAERQVLRQALISEGVGLYIRISAESEKEALQEAIVRHAQEAARITKARFDQGLVDFSAFSQAENNLAQAENELENIRAQIVTYKQQLSLLLGRYPTAELETGRFATLVLNNPDVPPGLPSELLKRRPDIKAALFELKAANALIGAAKAARFPSISLTAGLGYSSSELGELLQSGSLWRSLAAGVTQPVFAGGRLKAGQDAAKARYEQAVADYASTILEAFGEVEKCLAVRRRLVENICRMEEVANRQEKELELASRDFSGGAGDYAQLLGAASALAESRKSLVDLQAALLLNQISLRKALGGDWTVGNSG